MLVLTNGSSIEHFVNCYSVIIAYDALLGCNGDWKELVLRGVLHGGDNDR